MSHVPVVSLPGGEGEPFRIEGWKMEPMAEIIVKDANSSAIYIPFDPTKYAGRTVGILLMVSRDFTATSGTTYREFYARIVRVIIRDDGTVSAVASDESSNAMPHFLQLREDLTTKNASYTGISSFSPYNSFYLKADNQICVNVQTSGIIGGKAWIMSAE